LLKYRIRMILGIFRSTVLVVVVVIIIVVVVVAVIVVHSPTEATEFSSV
jgi:hypothetical protein